MSKRHLRLAGLVAAAVALTVLAHVLTADSLLGVWAVVEIVGGVAIGYAAIAVFGSGGGSRISSSVILAFALIPAIYGALYPNPVEGRVGYGLHGALVGGAVGLLLLAFFRRDQGMEAEAVVKVLVAAVLAYYLVVANVLTAARLTPPRGVLIVVEIVGGLAISYAAIAVFHTGGWPGIRGYVILAFALLGAVEPWTLGVSVENGLHGALIGGAAGLPVSFPLAWFIRWRQETQAEAEEEREEALAGHEDLVTPVQLPTWNHRFVARMLDTLLLVGVSLSLEVATGANWLLLALVLWPLYDIVLHAWFGATAAKALCRICVVDAGGAPRVRVLRAAGRWALLVVNVPFIWLQLVAAGDLLWSIDPRLSAMKPVYYGTILTTAAERRRLHGLGPVSAPRNSPRPSAPSARSPLC
jgi:hypothetical protein